MGKGDKKRPPGRPTKLNVEFIKKFCEIIEDGHTIRATCGIMGIHENTYLNWYKKGRDAKTDTCAKRFYTEVNIAKNKLLGDVEDVFLENIFKNRNSNDAKWYASKLAPDVYGNVDVSEDEIGELENYVDPSKEDKIFSGVEYE